MSYTRKQYRQSLAARLGGFTETITQGTTGLGYVLNLGLLGTSTALPTSGYAYEWVGVPSISTPQQARILKNGLDPTTGYATLERSLGAVVGAGVAVELHTKLPPFGGSQRQPGPISTQECVDLALRHLLAEDDASTLTLVTGQRDYSLPSWCDRPERLLDVRQLDALGSGYVSTWRTWEFRQSGRGTTLHFTQPFRFSSGSYTVRLVGMRPADTLINGTDSSVGLVAETDYAEPDLNAVDTVGLAFAYQTLRDGRTGAAGAHYADLYTTQVAQARSVRNFDHSNDPFTDVPRGASASVPGAVGVTSGA